MTRVVEIDCGNKLRLVCPEAKKVLSNATTPRVTDIERTNLLDKMAEKCGICPEVGECPDKIVFQRQ